MSGTAGGTQSNPYNLSPSLQALQGGLQGLANVMNPQAANSSNYMRANPPPVWTPGQPSADQLLEMILQMRQNSTMGLEDPYQAGISMPRVSLLGG